MKKLPIGIQTFSKLINQNYLYIDKTKEIFNLISNGGYFFLSRPRRFGKSLLVSTLKEIFTGNKKIFKGLYIYDRIKWEKHPVIHLDFTSTVYSEGEDAFKETIIDKLIKIGEKYNITLSKTVYLKPVFKELIEKLSAINSVVVLVDEYDKPIIDLISDEDSAIKNREILKDLYSVLKEAEEYLKFVFLTGVSKFSKVSIFSGLNNLQDITLSSKFATISGYTQNELEDYFKDNIELLSKEQNLNREKLLNEIKHWYNGYSWNGKNRLYNPFSILNLFSENKFSNYWFATGTPTFLINLIKKQKAEIIEFENKKITELTFESYDIKNLNLYSLLFQTGYLTITEVKREEEFTTYNLSYPNFEVKNSLLSYIIEDFTENRIDEIQPKIVELKKSLRQGNIQSFIEIVKSIFVKIPYTLHIEKEAYYHSLFYMILSLMGVNIDLEILTDKGRVDGVIKIEDKVYVIEFKYGVSGTDMDKLTGSAISQIKEKKYYERYKTKEKQIIFLGVGFIDKHIGFHVEYFNEII